MFKIRAGFSSQKRSVACGFTTLRSLRLFPRSCKRHFAVENQRED